MFKRFNGLRNIIAIASSQKGENSYAHGVRSDIGLAVSDRFTRFLYEYLKRPNSEKIQLKELFAQAESAQVRAYLMSTVQTDWSNYGDEGRNIDSITVGDFFANNAELIDVKKVDIKETYATILPGFAKSASFVVIDV